MEQALDRANHYILAEFYLVSSGQVMSRFVERLVRARQRQVVVYLLLDDFGSRGLEGSDLQCLTESGVIIARYNRLALRKWNRNFARDHRKLLLVDGLEAFVGGTGLSDQFIDKDHQLGWHELMLQLSGPAVIDWQRLFARTWGWSTDQPLRLPSEPMVSSPEGAALMKLSTCEGPQQQEIKVNFRRRINEAEHRVWLVTAYFLPSWSIRRALRRAARRGVDVRLLLPGRDSDHPGIYYASRRYYQRLLLAGVKIFEYQPRFSHAKVCLADGWVSLGSCNLDHWNLRWNLEANQEVIDAGLTEQLERVLAEDFERSSQISLQEWLARPWWQRLYEFLIGYIGAILLRLF